MTRRYLASVIRTDRNVRRAGAVRHNALSCDHLEYTGDAEIEALRGSATMPTVLPGAAFFLNMVHAPVRKMMDAGLPVAMASDCNPGSSPSGNMQLILSMACVNYRMLPEEAINATTINSAYAMDVVDQLGSIAVGKKANFFITYEFMPYAYGSNKVEKVFLNGKLVVSGQWSVVSSQWSAGAKNFSPVLVSNL